MDRLGADRPGSDAAANYAKLQSFFSLVQTVGSPVVGLLLDKCGSRNAFAAVFLASAVSYELLARCDTIEAGGGEGKGGEGGPFSFSFPFPFPLPLQFPFPLVWFGLLPVDVRRALGNRGLCVCACACVRMKRGVVFSPVRQHRRTSSGGGERAGSWRLQTEESLKAAVTE